MEDDVVLVDVVLVDADAELADDDVVAADDEAAVFFGCFSKNVACTDEFTVPDVFPFVRRDSKPAEVSAMVTESMLHGYAPLASARTTFSASAIVLDP